MNENIKHLRQICEDNPPMEMTRDEAAVCLDLLEADLTELRNAGYRASANLHKRIFATEDVIRRVLDDEESGKGWGPDVTTCGVLRAALEGIILPSISPEEHAEDAEREAKGAE